MVALFALLIATVVATVVVLSMSAWLLVPDHSRRLISAFESCRTGENSHDGVRGPQLLNALTGATHRLQQCLAPTYLEQALWGLYGVAILFAVAGLLYCVYPLWLRWRRWLVPLHEERVPELAEYLTELSQVAGLRRKPVFLLGSPGGSLGGLTFGGPRRRYIALDAGLVLMFVVDRAKFRAVVLHELAHARGPDVSITYLTKATWWSFVVLTWVPTLVISVVSRSLLVSVIAALLVVTLFVLLTRNAILRERELHADGVAAACDGPGSALDELVAGLVTPRRTWWRALLAYHPRPAWRRQVIADPTLLLRPRWWEMPVVGLATAVISANLQYVVAVAMPTWPVINALLAGAVVAPGLVVPLVIAVWRKVVIGSGPRLVLLAGALVVGYLVGQRLSVLALMGVGAGPFVRAADLLAGALLLVGLLATAAWAASATRSTHESVGQPSRRALPIVAAGATVAFGLWFALWFALGQFGLLTVWTSVYALVPYQMAIPNAPSWLSTAVELTGLSYLPLQIMAMIPVLAVCLALLWLVPVHLTRTGRRVHDLRHALRVGLGGAAVFTVVVVAFILLALVLVTPEARRSDGFRVGFHYLMVSLAVVVQLGVAVAVRGPYRAVSVPFAAMVSAVLSSVVLLFGADTFARAVNLWDRRPQRRFVPPEFTFAVDTTQQILAYGAVAAALGALLATALRRRVPAFPAAPRRAVLTGFAVVTAALTVAAAPAGYRSWITSTSTGTVELTGAECVIGTWVETSRESTLTISQEVGPMRFQSKGGVQAFNRDGSMTVQFAPSIYQGNGHVVRLEYSRAVTARYRVEGDRVLYSDVSRGAVWTITVDQHPPVITEEVTAFSPDTFTCRGDTMTQTGDGYSITLARVSHSR